MFNSMSHSWHIALIAEVTNIDVKGSAGLVCFGVVHKEGFELVGQANNSVGSIIYRWCFQLVGDSFDLALSPRTRDEDIRRRCNAMVVAVWDGGAHSEEEMEGKPAVLRPSKVASWTRETQSRERGSRCRPPQDQALECRGV